MTMRLSILTVCAAAQVALAQPSTDGFDWVTIGATGNAAYDRVDPFDYVAGRGSVNHLYRLGRTEVTTTQWIEFINAALARPDPLPLDISGPVIWGAEVDPTYHGPGTRYRVATGISSAGNLAAGGVSWREGAIFCNWLHNNKATNPEAFMNGAYDVSTFGDLDPLGFTDQAAHNPDARYWIPTIDEWLKGAYYDPNKDGDGGWWLSPNGTDNPIQYGPPGTGDANAGFALPDEGEYYIPLGSYPQTASPWGLLDLSGFTKEFTESIFPDPNNPGQQTARITAGSYWTNGWVGGDLPYQIGASTPGPSSPLAGFRFASSVPGPSSIGMLAMFFVAHSRRARGIK